MKGGWVLLLVVFVLLFAEAGKPTIGGQVDNIRDTDTTGVVPHGFRVMVYADQATDQVRASVRLYVDETNPLETVLKGTCLFVRNGTPIADMRDYVAYSGHGHHYGFHTCPHKN